ncbi:unnamed protein product [Spirodela intermedia]|uniref:Uncharacterized protein n=2 Tax=Spirodela intermedia TaxID=51605 RepID=A0A7I8JHB7_SPIIN|nr:unnamed protein product [Spirodela intermedia]CAA6669536.1 unnamed protein product [Spirodela intermedia]CAA7406504.1 unnamed protein product [Spirodela intermedia]
MGQKLGALWDRIQGKRQVLAVCDKVFDRCARDDFLGLTELHLATLLVFDCINKNFPKPHKSPPSQEEIDDVAMELRLKAQGKNAIDRAEFAALILRWVQRDLTVYLRNKVLHVLTAAGAMAALTRNAATSVPRIKRVVDTVPTPLLASAFAICFALIEDVRVE